MASDGQDSITQSIVSGVPLSNVENLSQMSKKPSFEDARHAFEDGNYLKKEAQDLIQENNEDLSHPKFVHRTTGKKYGSAEAPPSVEADQIDMDSGPQHGAQATESVEAAEATKSVEATEATEGSSREVSGEEKTSRVNEASSSFPSGAELKLNEATDSATLSGEIKVPVVKEEVQTEQPQSFLWRWGGKYIFGSGGETSQEEKNESELHVHVGPPRNEPGSSDDSQVVGDVSEKTEIDASPVNGVAGNGPQSEESEESSSNAEPDEEKSDGQSDGQSDRLKDEEIA